MREASEHSVEITRRGFLKGALSVGVCAAGVSADAIAAPTAFADEAADASLGTPIVKNPQYTFEYAPDPIDESLIVETVDCEIVVVGAGVASMGASMYAACQGADVHVLEKGPGPGVHRLSVAGLNSQMALGMGLPEVDPKDFSEDLYRYSGSLQASFPVISRYAKDSGKYIDWLQSKIVEKGWTLIPMGNSHEESVLWDEYNTMYSFMNEKGESIIDGKSPDWVQLMADIAEENGAKFHFCEPAVRLEREGDRSGRCTAVISQDVYTGEYRRYRASKGIVLAAGDFYQDKEMVHKYCRNLEKCTSSIAELNNTGDMHKAAMWIGAAMDDFSAGDLFAFENVPCNNWCAPMPGDEDYNPAYDIIRGCMWAPALSIYPMLWVDNSGRRFVNEGANAFMQGTAHNVLANPLGQAWTIYDGAWESKLPEGHEQLFAKLCGINATNFSCNTQREIDKEVELGLIQKYDSIEELIAGCGFDEAVFTETLQRYNLLCEQGKDEDCYKDSIWMTPIDTPPYYAAHWGAMITSTRCGLRTDEHSRVLDTDGAPIPGLYAAGNNGGNFYGITYPGTLIGTGIGHGQFFAWTAMRDILGEDVIGLKKEA